MGLRTRDRNCCLVRFEVPARVDDTPGLLAILSRKNRFRYYRHTSNTRPLKPAAWQVNKIAGDPHAVDRISRADFVVNHQSSMLSNGY